MDKMYSAQDVANVVSKVEELAKVNAELEELLYRGTNDENLVRRKRELESNVRKFKGIVSDVDETTLENDELDEDLISLKKDLISVLMRYKERKRVLQNIIRSYTNGNSD